MVHSVDSEIRAAIDRALEEGRAQSGAGVSAGYIPELARVEPSLFAIAVQSVSGAAFEAGDVSHRFTLQSVSKLFALALALRAGARDLFELTSLEPSGDAFHSIVRLEEEHGRPRNPLINAGAIVVSERLPGDTSRAKARSLAEFLGCLSDAVPGFDEAVYRSEAATGHRNRALAHYMRHFGVLESPEVAVDTYFRQCSLTASVGSLARMGLFLANDGVDPVSGERIVSAQDNRMLLALMATCGLYDEVGRFAVTAGIPAKSGVSGAILGIAPGRMAIACFGPALGPKGNSMAGMRALEVLSRELELSVYAPYAPRGGSR